jgi:hypothetical protein
VQILTGSALSAAFSDDTTAVIVYDTQTVPVTSAPAAGCVTVTEAKITCSRFTGPAPVRRCPQGRELTRVGCAVMRLRPAGPDDADFIAGLAGRLAAALAASPGHR